jgi:hypothetical protein
MTDKDKKKDRPVSVFDLFFMIAIGLIIVASIISSIVFLYYKVKFFKKINPKGGLGEWLMFNQMMRPPVYYNYSLI